MLHKINIAQRFNSDHWTEVDLHVGRDGSLEEVNKNERSWLGRIIAPLFDRGWRSHRVTEAISDEALKILDREPDNTRTICNMAKNIRELKNDSSEKAALNLTAVSEVLESRCLVTIDHLMERVDDTLVIQTSGLDLLPEIDRLLLELDAADELVRLHSRLSDTEKTAKLDQINSKREILTQRRDSETAHILNESPETALVAQPDGSYHATIDLTSVLLRSNRVNEILAMRAELQADVVGTTEARAESALGSMRDLTDLPPVPAWILSKKTPQQPMSKDEFLEIITACAAWEFDIELINHIYRNTPPEIIENLSEEELKQCIKLICTGSSGSELEKALAKALLQHFVQVGIPGSGLCSSSYLGPSEDNHQHLMWVINQRNLARELNSVEFEQCLLQRTTKVSRIKNSIISLDDLIAHYISEWLVVAVVTGLSSNLYDADGWWENKILNELLAAVMLHVLMLVESSTGGKEVVEAVETRLLKRLQRIPPGNISAEQKFKDRLKDSRRFRKMLKLGDFQRIHDWAYGASSIPVEVFQCQPIAARSQHSLSEDTVALVTSSRMGGKHSLHISGSDNPVYLPRAVVDGAPHLKAQFYDTTALQWGDDFSPEVWRYWIGSELGATMAQKNSAMVLDRLRVECRLLKATPNRAPNSLYREELEQVVANADAEEILTLFRQLDPKNDAAAQAILCNALAKKIGATKILYNATNSSHPFSVSLNPNSLDQAIAWFSEAKFGIWELTLETSAAEEGEISVSWDDAFQKIQRLPEVHALKINLNTDQQCSLRKFRQLFGSPLSVQALNLVGAGSFRFEEDARPAAHSSSLQSITVSSNGGVATLRHLLTPTMAEKIKRVHIEAKDMKVTSLAEFMKSICGSVEVLTCVGTNTALYGMLPYEFPNLQRVYTENGPVPDMAQERFGMFISS